ncbi:hypothetical protein ACI797_19160 [Geodermatophilus sp. SYSU D00691]
MPSDSELATPTTGDVPALPPACVALRVEDNFVATIGSASPSEADGTLLLW